MKSFTNMFADLLNDGRPGRSSSSTSSSSAAAAQQARGGRSTTGSRSASTAWESFDEPSSSSSSGFAAPTPATTHPGFPAPIRGGGVAKPEDGVHPLTREWADRIGNRAVRDAFLEHPIGDYTESHKLNVWTGSWNTNGKRPPPNLDISQWLDVDASQPDIVVVGFQEIVPLTPGKVLAVEDEKATKEWEAIIERALHKGDSSPGPPHASSSVGGGDSAGGWASFDDAAGGAWASFDAARPTGNQGRVVQDGETKIEPNSSNRRFTRLACKQLVGVYITVWVTQEAAAHVRDVRVATVSTGFNLGVGALQVATLGNKGGAAVWMRMYNTRRSSCVRTSAPGVNLRMRRSVRRITTTSSVSSRSRRRRWRVATGRRSGRLR